MLLFISLVEVSVWFTEYYTYNQNGTRIIVLYYIATVVTVIRLTMYRLLLIIIAFGFPLVRQQLGSISKRIFIGVCIIYFIVELTFAIITATKYTSDSSSAQNTYLLQIPSIIITFVTYSWSIFFATQSIRSLKEQNQPITIIIYRNFRYLLLATTIADIIFVTCQA